MTTCPNVAMTCPALPVPMISFIADTSSASRNSVVTSSRAGNTENCSGSVVYSAVSRISTAPARLMTRHRSSRPFRQGQNQHGDDADQRNRHRNVGLLGGFGEKAHQAAHLAAVFVRWNVDRHAHPPRKVQEIVPQAEANVQGKITSGKNPPRMFPAQSLKKLHLFLMSLSAQEVFQKVGAVGGAVFRAHPDAKFLNPARD